MKTMPDIAPRPVPIDLTAKPGDCDCEFQPDPTDPDECTPATAWHYLRKCAFCGNEWWGLHCPHDGYQNPCRCGKRPVTI